MARTIRLHLDEQAANAVAFSLRRLGNDVTTTPEAVFAGPPTPSSSPARTLNAGSSSPKTTTSSFSPTSAATGTAGIVYCKLNTRSIGEIIAGLELIWELCKPAEMQNRVEFL